MEVRFDESQDITLRLTDEEANRLLNGPTEYFEDMHICSDNPNEQGKHHILLRGGCKELNAHFFLGYSRDLNTRFCCPSNSQLFDKLFDMEGMGKILIPEYSAYPFRINLSGRGIEHFREGWTWGVGYNGSSKLFIFKMR